MPLEDRFVQDKPYDPNAPVSFDRAKAQSLLRAAPGYIRLPNSDIVMRLADQLRCALEIIDGTGTKVEVAQNEATRFQREAQTANAEVKTMQEMVARAREERDAAVKELAELKLKPEAAPVPDAAAPIAAVSTVRRRGPNKAKIVSIADNQTKTGS